MVYFIWMSILIAVIFPRATLLQAPKRNIKNLKRLSVFIYNF